MMDDSAIVEKVVKPLLAKNAGKTYSREYWKRVMNANFILELLFRMAVCGGIWLIMAHYSQEIASCVLFVMLLFSIKSNLECRNSHILGLIYNELDKMNSGEVEDAADSSTDEIDDSSEKDA